MTFAELKQIATDNQIPTALLQIEKAEGIHAKSAGLSKFETMQAQQKINTCLETAKLAVEDFKADQARLDRFSKMSAEELAVATASTERDIEHAPLRELSSEERKASDESISGIARKATST